MKKAMCILLSLAVSLTAVSAVWASPLEDLLDYLYENGVLSEAEIVDPDYVPDVDPPDLYTYGDFTYWINDDHPSVTIAAYTGEDDVIVIPSEIEELPVTEIGPDAFKYQEMKTVVFPEGLRRIDGNSFEYCTIKESVQFPENITIGWDAFSYAALPPVITIPANVTVESKAFSYCDTIEQVFVEHDAVIQGRAFGYCDNLHKVVCAGESIVGEDAFEYCRELKQVILCGSVSVDDEAFPYCGEAEIVREAESEFDNLKGAESSDTGSSFAEKPAGDLRESLSSQWEVVEDPEITDERREILDKAVAGILDVWYEPAALLAQQESEGIKYYCFLAREYSYESPEDPYYVMIYVGQRAGEYPEFLDMQGIEFGLN